MKPTCFIFCICIFLFAVLTCVFVNSQYSAIFTFLNDDFDALLECLNNGEDLANLPTETIKTNSLLRVAQSDIQENLNSVCCLAKNNDKKFDSLFYCDNISVAKCTSSTTNVVQNFQTTAKGCIVMERNSGRVLFEHNADERLPMASTTKIVTALTVINNGNLDEVVAIPREACGIEGSSVYLREGEKLTVRQLLYGLMLRSGNDCATALALHVGGSVEKFAQMMNETARSLGCCDCNFVNPHGLHDENHYTSARNLAIITCKALQNDDFAQIVSTKAVKIPNDGYDYPRVLSNKNKLLYNFDDADGVKTGYTKKAGRCFVGSATRNGMQVVVVLLNCGPMFEETSQMLNVAFANYHNVCILPKNKLCGVVYKRNKPVYYYCEQSFSYPILQSESLQRKIHLDEQTQQIEILLNDTTIAMLPLTAIKQ